MFSNYSCSSFAAQILGVIFVFTNSGCITTNSLDSDIAADSFSMNRIESVQVFDDYPLEPLRKGLEQTLAKLAENRTETLRFGKLYVNTKEYIASLRKLLDSTKSSSREQFLGKLSEMFYFYGPDFPDAGRVDLTAYLEPVVKGALNPTDKFTTPLYRRPPDLIEVPLKNFINEDFSHLKISEKQVMRGRLDGKTLLPYYSREQIDLQGVLRGRGLEICWVSPYDAYDIQVQGSGSIELDNGGMKRVGYDGQNGRKNTGLSASLDSILKGYPLTLEGIRNYLHSLPVEKMKRILVGNASYVFFRELDSRPITAFGTEVIDGRTIASDARFFPKGSLAFLQFEMKQENGKIAWTSRLVIDQDTGGHIKGNRIDLYLGTGEEARRLVPRISKTIGKIFYLVPKSIFTKHIENEMDQMRVSN